jgi:hypothetical protein
VNGTAYGEEVSFTTEGLVLYSENFSQNPGYTVLSKSGTNWYNSAAGNYKVIAFDYFDKFWAYGPQFKAYENNGNILVEFDISYKDLDRDAFAGVTFYSKAPLCSGCSTMPDEGRVFSIQLTSPVNSNDTVIQLRMVSDYPIPGFYSYYTPQIKESTFYHFKMTYYGAKKLADMEVRSLPSNSVFYSQKNLAFDLSGFSYVAVGFYTFIEKYSVSEITIDNIIVQKPDSK